jgi:acetyl esterase/lipase
MTTLDFMDPAAFPAQLPPSSPRVAEYVAQVNAASLDVISRMPPKRYSYGPSVSHKLDVFGAEPGRGPRPALVFFHGGLWSCGYLWWTSFMAPGVLGAGGVLVAPTYRLGPEHRFPAQLHDVAAAIAWVWTNADRIGVDRSRIVVGGHSAGGHLSALATLHADALGGAGASGRIVRGCLPVSCSFNVHYPDATPESREARVYRTLLARQEDDCAASPVNHLVGGAPPFHIVYGERDYSWVKRTSREMADAMQRRRYTAQAEEWAGADHFGTHLALKDPRHPWYERLQEAFAGAQETGC